MGVTGLSRSSPAAQVGPAANPRIFSKSCDVGVPKAGDEERALGWIGSGGFDEAGMHFVLIRFQEQKSEVRVEERIDISFNF